MVTLLDTTMSDIETELVYLRAVDSFDWMELTRGSENYRFDVKRADDALDVTIGGKAVEMADFQALYGAFMDTTKKDYVELPEGAALYASIRFQNRTSGSVDTLAYYELDERRLFVSVNGVGREYVLRKDVGNIFAVAAQISQNLE